MIEEDKRMFAVRRICSTWCGGMRCVYNEETETYISPVLYPAQLVLYLVFPSLIAVTMFIPDL